MLKATQSSSNQVSSLEKATKSIWLLFVVLETVAFHLRNDRKN